VACSNHIAVNLNLLLAVFAIECEVAYPWNCHQWWVNSRWRYWNLG